MLMSAAQTKRKVIARKFGDFMCDVFYLIYNTALDYVDQGTIVEVSGVQAEVNPSQWKERTPATVKLALGYAERDKRAMELQGVHSMLANDPILAGSYSPQNAYELAKQILENKGIPNPEAVLTSPDQIPPPQPDPMAELNMQREQLAIAQMQEQIEQMKTKRQIDLMNAETKRLEAETNRARVANQMEVQQAKVVIEGQRAEATTWKEQREVELAAQAEQQTAIFNP